MAIRPARLQIAPQICRCRILQPFGKGDEGSKSTPAAAHANIGANPPRTRDDARGLGDRAAESRADRVHVADYCSRRGNRFTEAEAHRHD